MSQATSLLASPNDKIAEFKPFGADETIKLSVSIVRNMLCKPTRSGALVDDVQAMRFVMMCRARKLNPFEGDAFLVGYDAKDGPEFSIITAHQAFLKRAEMHPEYDGMDSGVIVLSADGKTISDREGDFYLDGEKVLGGWAIVHFKSRSHPTKRRLRLSTRQKNTPIWNNDPAGMIVKCFDQETEVLTDAGFQKFTEVTGKILQVTDNGLEPTNAVPFFKQYDGPMVLFDNRNGNFVVTLNHDMPISMNGGPETPLEAGELLDLRQRDNAVMPLVISGSRPDCLIDDSTIRLAAAYIADGSDNSKSSGFSISVSRKEKIGFLNGLGRHSSSSKRNDAGRQGVLPDGRIVVTKADKTAFYYSRTDEITHLVGRGKKINHAAILSLSMRQARLLIDTWALFDGHKPHTMLRGRLYSSRPEHMAAIELIACVAGYSVSQRRTRTSSGFVGFYISLTNRPTTRITKALVSQINNPGDSVCCVTVPSHKIIVRRHGFSHVCHQCTEADALRSSFPTLLGGMYLDEELPRGDAGITKSDNVRRVLDKLGNGKSEAAPTPMKEPEPNGTAEEKPATNGRTYTELRDETKAAISAALDNLGMDKEERAKFIHERTGRRNIDLLSQEQGEELLRFLSENTKESEYA